MEYKIEEMYGINIAWKFEGRKYPSYKDFSKAVIEYNRCLDKDINEEDLQRIIVNAPAFTLIYDNRSFGENFTYTIEADNKKNLSIGEVLWKLNDHLSEKNILVRHCYFEGICPDGYVRLGS